MPCLAVLISVFFPRLALVLIWLLSDYLDSAYQTIIWPVLGFVFMPYTTLAYAAAMNEHGSASGWWLVLVIAGVLADLSTHGGSASRRRK